MKVTISDPLVMVEGWTPDLDKIGEYTLKQRKTAEEVRAEKQRLKQLFPNSTKKVSPMKYTRKTVISKDQNNASIAYFLPGLWPRVKAHLDRNEIKYEIEDKRNKDIRPELDLNAFEGVEFRENQDVAIALIAASDCGIIETATAFGKSFCIALICKAFPTLNIVVTTSSTQVVSTLYEYLCKTIPGQVGILCAGKNSVANKRVIVTTLKSLPNIDQNKVHLVLVDECHAIGDNVAGNDLMKFCFARRFGFSASPVRNDGTALVMESILGPTILKMTYQEAVEAKMVTPMKYLMLPCSSCPQVATNPSLPEVTLKRWAYWRNDYRNKAIQRFVYDLKKSYDGQVLIMVSTLEAAVSLHRLLPWFKVAYYGASDVDELAKKFPKERYPDMDLAQYKMSQKQLDIMRAAFAKGTLRYIISTKVFRQGVNFNALQVLIRADADVSSIEGIQIPGRLSRLDKGKDYAYLVDVLDTFSPWAHNRALAREKLYKEQQWTPVTYQELIDDLSR